MSQYATLAELASLAVPIASVGIISDADKNKALQEASEEADGYLRSRYTLPLIDWSLDLTQHVANIAVYRLATREGYTAQGGDETARQGYEDALAWLRNVAKSVVTPDITDSSDPPSSGSGVSIISRPQRGWDRW